MTAQHEPTRETREIVKALSCFGVKQAKISEYIHVDEKTLRLYYRHEIDHGRDMATSEVVRSLHKLATKANGGMLSAVACKIWLTLIAGRSERTAVALVPEASDYPPGESPREIVMARLAAMHPNLVPRAGEKETVEVGGGF
jgi:hypothetical protein